MERTRARIGRARIRTVWNSHKRLLKAKAKKEKEIEQDPARDLKGSY